MGGNAIPDARRINRVEYDDIVKRVGGERFGAIIRDNAQAGVGQFEKYVRITLHEVKPYRLKSDFGDVDFVCDDRIDFADLWARFRPSMCAVNGDTFSMRYQGAQVDIIRVPHEYIQTTLNYYAYNDLGNLMGVLARTMGLKYGSKGLFVRHADAHGNSVGDIYVATDMKEILPVLGLSWERYQKGFDTLDAMFEFIQASTLYAPQQYKRSMQGNRHKKRDATRKTYLAFRERIQNDPDRDENDLQTAIDRQTIYLRSTFKHVDQAIEAMNRELAENQAFRERFNGELVESLTGIKGKQLGKFMSFIRSIFSREEIARLDDEELTGVISFAHRFWNLKKVEE